MGFVCKRSKVVVKIAQVHQLFSLEVLDGHLSDSWIKYYFLYPNGVLIWTMELVITGKKVKFIPELSGQCCLGWPTPPCMVVPIHCKVTPQVSLTIQLYPHAPLGGERDHEHKVFCSRT